MKSWNEVQIPIGPLDERKGYRWPASSLTDHEMEILYHWRKETGTPISELLRQAVIICQDIILNKEVIRNESNWVYKGQ